MVCLSGGKDSYTMLDMLIHLKRAAPINFTIVVVNLDQKQPGFPAHVLPEYLDKLGVEYHIETQDTYSIVMDKIPEGRTLCSLCSRLRRGILYRVAEELKATKIALGHHMDDMVETLFLNMFHGQAASAAQIDKRALRAPMEKQKHDRGTKVGRGGSGARRSEPLSPDAPAAGKRRCEQGGVPLPPRPVQK